MNASIRFLHVIRDRQGPARALRRQLRWIMTNWIISHTTRFKAAVHPASASPFLSDDGTRERVRPRRGFRRRPFSSDSKPTGIVTADICQRMWKPRLLCFIRIWIPRSPSSRESMVSGLQHFACPARLFSSPREPQPTRTGDLCTWSRV